MVLSDVLIAIIFFIAVGAVVIFWVMVQKDITEFKKELAENRNMITIKTKPLINKRVALNSSYSEQVDSLRSDYLTATESIKPVASNLV